MNEQNLEWLMRWYAGECNGDWEHSYGVSIDTLDNPGWTLKIDLRETSVEGRSFAKRSHGAPASDLEEWQKNGSWWVVESNGDRFEAACGPLDLSSVIGQFRDWVEKSGR